MRTVSTTAGRSDEEDPENDHSSSLARSVSRGLAADAGYEDAEHLDYQWDQ